MKMKRMVLSKSTKVQTRFMRLIILSLALPTLLLGGCLYFLIFLILAQQIAIPEFIAHVLFPAIHKINIILLFGLPVVFLVILVASAIISHRILGPVERLKREVDGIANGKYDKRITLRKYDYLKPVADSINRLLDKIVGGEN